MKSVSLRPITLEDTHNIVSWRNQDFVRRNLFDSSKLTEGQHRRYFENYITTGKVKQYIIAARENGEYQDIGTVFLKNFAEDGAELGIFIGNAKYLGGGYGTLAITQLTATGFNEFGLKRIWALVYVDNTASLKCFQKAGFVECKAAGQEKPGICRLEIQRE